MTWGELPTGAFYAGRYLLVRLGPPCLWLDVEVGSVVETNPTTGTSMGPPPRDLTLPG